SYTHVGPRSDPGAHACPGRLAQARPLRRQWLVKVKPARAMRESGLSEGPRRTSRRMRHVTTVHQSFGSTTQDGSTEATDPARVFLDAFADIERLLRQKARADQKVRFVDLVSRLARHDRLVREHDSALRAFASLRNAIA